jgi:lipoprotein-releasing system permease protein
LSFEAFIGWRYLFRRERNRSVVGLFVIALVLTLVAGTGFWILSRLPHSANAMGPLGLVAGIAFGALFVIIFGLLLFLSVFTTVAIVGVMVGVSALMVVLSVTSGFQDEFKDKVLGVNAHVIVMKWGADFSEYGELEQKIGRLPGVVGVAPFVFNEMQAARGTTQATILMKGIDPRASTRVLSVGGQMDEGSVAALAESPPGILIGRELAKKLRARIGDTVKLLSPLSSMDATLLGKGAQPPRSGDFKVVGIFYAGFDEYDRRLVYLALPDSQRLMGRGDVVSGVEIKLRDADRARSFVGTLEKAIGKAPYRIIDWEELNHNLFTALRLQKFAISLFLTLIIAVAAANIVASLTMIVLSKRKEIAILKAMGASSLGVAGVFQVAGLTIGALGVVTGTLFGGLMCLVAQRYRYPLDPKIYLISQLPVRIEPLEVLLTALVTIVICLLATIYPALKAADMRPVEGLRYD